MWRPVSVASVQVSYSVEFEGTSFFVGGQISRTK